MTNGIHGVEFRAGGERYVLRYDFNAVCEMESAAGRELVRMGANASTGLPTLARLFIAGTASTARIMLWAGLLHQDTDLSMSEAGDILQLYLNDGNKMEDIFRKVDQAMNAAGYETAAGEMAEQMAMGASPEETADAETEDDGGN